MTVYGFDERGHREVVKTVQRVRAMPGPTGKRRRRPEGDGGGRGVALRVTGSGTAQGGVTYYPARRKTWTAGVIGESTADVWLFNWQGRPMSVGEIFEPAVFRGSLVVGANPSRPVYSFSLHRIVCVNGVAEPRYDPGA